MAVYITFINSRRDIDWLGEILRVKIAHNSVVIYDDADANTVTLRLFKKTDPVFLNQPDYVSTIASPMSENLARVIRQRFPQR